MSGALLKFAVLVYAFLDEDFLKRGEVELLLQFVLADFKLLAEKTHGVVNRIAQHVAYRKELRLVVFYDAAVGRYVDFAVREGVQGVDGLV